MPTQRWSWIIFSVLLFTDIKKKYSHVKSNETQQNSAKKEYT